MPAGHVCDGHEETKGAENKSDLLLAKQEFILQVDRDEVEEAGGARIIAA